LSFFICFGSFPGWWYLWIQWGLHKFMFLLFLFYYNEEHNAIWWPWGQLMNYNNPNCNQHEVT
jgi:hypothetical protein